MGLLWQRGLKKRLIPPALLGRQTRSMASAMP
jgi:hypothetical protein